MLIVITISYGQPAVEGPQAGDRAPDAQRVIEPRKRLFDLFRHGGFTLLAVPRAGVAGGPHLATSFDTATPW